MMRRWLLVLLVLLTPLAQAATSSAGSGQAVQAFLDRSQVSLGDTVTLNIQSSGAIGTPDLSPLQKDFQVLGASRSSSVQIINGRTTSTSQLGIALKPLRTGTLTIPSLQIGGAKTQPLTLQVGAAPTGGVGKAGDPVFMQANVQSNSPFVDQQTVYTVRLFYLPGVDGALGDPSADGASLIKLDRDHRYTVDRDGYTYRVIERSWALIPQRTGAITVDGPEFQGQRMAAGTWFNSPNALLNNPNAFLNGQVPGFGAPVRATAPAVRIDARPAPVNAGKPWLPARDVQLKLTGLPANGEVDAATPLTLTLSISASGQPADALPEPELPPIAGARVYPDQTQDSTDDSTQWLQGTRTRSFAIVPDRNGRLSIPAITLSWWNVAQGRAEQAKLPAHTLQVTGVVANAPAASTPSAVTAPANGSAAASSYIAPHVSAPVAAPGGEQGTWRTIAVASLALWVLAIVLAAVWWRIRRGRPAPLPSPRQPQGIRSNAMRSSASHGSADAQSREAASTAAPKPDARVLRTTALDAARAGDAAACEHALLAWARLTSPETANLGALRGALSDPAQRDALDALQRARWHGGDAEPACAAVARAFARGIAWQSDDTPARGSEPDLPPLYPS